MILPTSQVRGLQDYLPADSLASLEMFPVRIEHIGQDNNLKYYSETNLKWTSQKTSVQYSICIQYYLKHSFPNFQKKDLEELPW